MLGSEADTDDDAMDDEVSCTRILQFKTALNQYCSLYRHKERQIALQTAVQSGCCLCVNILLDAGANPRFIPVAEDDKCNRDKPLHITYVLKKVDPETFTAVYKLVSKK